MDAEQFLDMQNKLESLMDTVKPILEILRRMRMSFIEDVGMGENAADLMTIQWFETMMSPMLKEQMNGN